MLNEAKQNIFKSTQKSFYLLPICRWNESHFKFRKANVLKSNGNTIQLLSWYKHRTKCMLSRAWNINRGIENIWLWIWFSNYFMCNLFWNAFIQKSSNGKISIEDLKKIYFLICFYGINNYLVWHFQNFAPIAFGKM